MNGNSLLVDTNILLYLLSGDQTLVTLLNEKALYISFITQLELLGYKDLTDEQINKIKELISHCIVIDINETIKELTIQIRREYGIKLPDCIIAASAMYLGLPLLSADKELNRIKQTDLILYEP
jgi:predicted nucleic acid-binding protein